MNLFERSDGNYDVIDYHGKEVLSNATKQDAEKYINDNKNAVKFEQYVLPGGENYKEVVVDDARHTI